MSGRRLLLDTASLYFGAYFGVPTRFALDGVTPVNAVCGLLDIIAKFIRETHPDEVAACWDNDWRPSWRVDLVNTYKSHRVSSDAHGTKDREGLPIGAGCRGAQTGDIEIADPELRIQVPLILAVLKAAGIPVVGAEGFEADDVIGTLAATAPGHVDVVTGDRDLFQLVGDEVTVLYVARGISKYETVDDDWLSARYGIIGSQYADYAVLRGDPSDGLPGVRGIGEKTAAKLLADHGSLHKVLAASALSPNISKMLASAIEYIPRALNVVTVRTDLSLRSNLTLPHEVADKAEFRSLRQELALGSAADRLVEALEKR